MDGEKASYTRQLFTGTIDDEILFPYPRIDPEEDRKVSELLRRLEAFCEAHVDREWIDENERIPDEVVDGLAKLGLFGISIPSEYGGMGLSQSAYCRVFDFITGYDVGLAIMLGVHLSIGVKGIQLVGSEEQKRRYLPKAATGEWFASFALTEPTAGSDATGIRSRAEPSADGSHFVLNGSKIWIGNGSFSRIIVAFAQTSVERNGQLEDRVTAFILEPEMEGYRRGPALRKMGARGSNQAELHFENARVPAGQILGGLGNGFRVAMQVLSSGRQGLSAGAAGGIKRCLTMATEWATGREQFGRPIAEYELIQGKLAAMAADAYTAECTAYLTTGMADRGDVDYALESAAAKVWNSDALDRAVDELVQIAGGRGYVKPFPYERMYRDSRITRIFEGTNEILRLFIGLSGMQEPGEYLRQIGQALREPIRRIGLLSEFATERVRQVLGRGEPSVEEQVHPRLRTHFDYLIDHTRDLRSSVDRVIRRHGKEIVDRQFIVARVADMAIELFTRSAVLSRTQALLEAHDRGERKSPPMAGGGLELDGPRIEELLRLCDLACQRSGLRFRAARESLHDARDDLTRAVALDVIGRNSRAPQEGAADPSPGLAAERSTTS
jgi:alkylation response protein AidB-like acyl-CoA dehydrogenase